MMNERVRHVPEEELFTGEFTFSGDRNNLLDVTEFIEEVGLSEQQLVFVSEALGLDGASMKEIAKKEWSFITLTPAELGEFEEELPIFQRSVRALLLRVGIGAFWEEHQQHDSNSYFLRIGDEYLDIADESQPKKRSFINDGVGVTEEPVGIVEEVEEDSASFTLDTEDIDDDLQDGDVDYSDPRREDASRLVSDDFYELIVGAIDEGKEEEANEAIILFARGVEIEFLDDSEIELSPVAAKQEVEIGNFIQSVASMGSFNLLALSDLLQLQKLYNRHNLLAFAKQVALDNTEETSQDHVYMIYRYRTVLKCLDDAVAAALNSVSEEPEPRVGARTWGGDVHPYGHDAERIYISEYKDFADTDPTEDATQEPLSIDGKPVRGINIEYLG